MAPLVPQPVEVTADAEDDRHPVVVDQHAEEADQGRVGVGEQVRERGPLLLGRELRREEERRQSPLLVQGIGELPELLTQQVELALLQSDLEQRPCIYASELFHPWSLPSCSGRC